MLEARRVYAAPSRDPNRPGAAAADLAAGLERPDLVVVGAASRDVTADDPRGWRLGGPATYCSLAAARLGLRVGCLLGVDPLAATAGELQWLPERRSRAASCARWAAARSSRTSRTTVTGASAGCRRATPCRSPRCRTSGEAWLGWLLVPVAGEVGDEWAAVAAPGRECWRRLAGVAARLRPGRLGRATMAAASPLLGRAGLVCASVDDLPPQRRAWRPPPVRGRGDDRADGRSTRRLALRGSRLARYSALPADADRGRRPAPATSSWPP